MTALMHLHIEVRPDGVPYIANSETKVVEIVLWQLAHGWDAHEIHRQHPDLSLAQVHSALAYYYDHQPAMDEDIARRLRREQELIDGLGVSPVRLKLQSAKRAALGLQP